MCAYNLSGVVVTPGPLKHKVVAAQLVLTTLGLVALLGVLPNATEKMLDFVMLLLIGVSAFLFVQLLTWIMVSNIFDPVPYSTHMQNT